MQAVGYRSSKSVDEPDALVDFTLHKPSPEGRDILVRVAAISVNPVDTKVRQRSEPPQGECKVLGWDAVGEVCAVGDQVSRFSEGDKVWYAGDITRSGSNAEYQLVDERIVGHAPKTLSVAEAAAMPLTAITAWELLFDRLKLSSNSASDLLIIGAAGGVGSILIQLAKTLTQVNVIATASRTQSQQWVRSLGADHVINHHQPMRPQLQALGLEHVNDVICTNQTDQHFTSIVDVLAPQGRLALIDDPAAPLDIMQMKQKSLSLHWELMFTRSMFGTADMQKQGDLLSTVASMVDKKQLSTTLGEHYGVINAHNVLRAHRLIESGQAIGKIVLEAFGD